MLKKFAVVILLSAAAVTAAAKGKTLTQMGLDFVAPTVPNTSSVVDLQVGKIVFDLSSGSLKVLDQSSNWDSLLSPWSVSGSDVYYSSGNVGVGTSTPAAPIDVVGSENRVMIGANGASIVMRALVGGAIYHAYTDGSTYTNFIGTETGSGSGIYGSGNPYSLNIGTQTGAIDFFPAQSKSLTLHTNGTTEAFGKVVANQGTQLNTSASQPSCDSGNRGLMWVIQGGSGVADVAQICLKDATDAYVWTNL